MALKTDSIAGPWQTPRQSEQWPTEALKRPNKLKKWSAEIVKIVKTELNRVALAGEPSEKAAFFDGWGFRDGALTRHDFGRILKKITGCGSLVELRAAVNPSTGEVGRPVVHAANYCGQHTICPFCAGRVQDRRLARFHDPIGEMARKFPFSYMITATIPPTESWSDSVNNLISGWQRLRKMGQVRRRRRKDGSMAVSRSGGEWGKIKAGLAKMELKRGMGSGLPHCHYHAIVFSEERLDFQVWSKEEKKKAKELREPLYKIPWENAAGWVPASKITREWYTATGDAVNFDVSPIKHKEEHKRDGLSYSESVFRQSIEVLKYATKFDSCPKQDQKALFVSDFVGIRDATYSRRLFSAYGEFRGVCGDDFTGGGECLSSGPLIFESRWQGIRYSDLVERKAPIFPNMEKTESVSAKLSVLNSALGAVRKMRFAIRKSKEIFFRSGRVTPAFYSLRKILESGGFEDVAMAIEPPSYLINHPSDLDAWERWMDEVMTAGREYYASVRENCRINDLERFEGTLEEQSSARDFNRRLWIRSPVYSEHVAKLFRETILESRERLEYAAHSPPN